MKSERTDGNIFPCLMLSRITNIIVLFSGSRVGTVVHGNNSFPMAEHRTIWEMDHFVPYLGIITLEN